MPNSLPWVVELPSEIGVRSLPLLFSQFRSDFGRIEPHKPLFPPAIELAIFALLTVQWEEITVHCDIEWRPFRIPWIYTLDDDLFARVQVPQRASSLSWEPYIFENNEGELIECEKPVVLPLEENAYGEIESLNDDLWQKTLRSKVSPLFSGPVRHFLVRGFGEDGIDEFLSHMLTIEAALGLVADQNRTPKLPNNPGPTARVAARLNGLLESLEAGSRYKFLFNQRSEFIHGRAMTEIGSASVLSARRLARQCVCALLNVANTLTNFETREEFLNDLLTKNWSKLI